MKYPVMLKNIMRQRRLQLYRASKLIGVTIFTLQSFLAGVPVKAASEAKLIAWIEGVS